MTQSKSAATKRLLRDLREWNSCCHQAPCITAAPLEDNIFEWHANFAPNDGALKDIIFHLVLLFPDNYPLHHPKVALLNYLNHPNVFYGGPSEGYWICLDMIKCSNWSAAYSVSSILMQLLSFLIATKAPQDFGADKIITHSISEIAKMRKSSIQFQCDGCHHTFSTPFPAAYKSSTKHVTVNNDNTYDPAQCGINYWRKYMHYDVENIVIDLLNVCDLLLLSRVNRAMKTLVSQSKSFRMAQFSCWYSKIDLRYAEYMRTNGHNSASETVLLGYGIKPIFYENTAMHRQFQTYFDDDKHLEGLQFPMLLKCETTFDLLSKDAFEIGQIRRTPMMMSHNDEVQFTHWMPMYIAHGRYHGIEALRVLKEYTLKVYQTQYKSMTTYHPFMSVHLICSIMSSLLVQLMKAITSNKLHHSINVLETYFHFYHLLLAVYHHPIYHNILHPMIQMKCVHFILNAQQRTKAYVPNIGNFMMWFALCDNISLKHIFEALLEETLIRNQRWIIKKYGASYEQNDAKQRLHDAFLGSRVSKKLFMFQYFFMKNIAGLGVISPAQKFHALNQSLGCVDSSVSLQLQAFCKSLDEITDFEAFFSVIEMKFPGNDAMARFIQQAVRISAERKYHIPTVAVTILDECTYSDSFDYSAFFEAVYKNDIHAVKQLICDMQQTVDKMDINNINWSEIHTNSCLQLDVVFDKHMTDIDGSSPLMIAAKNGNKQMVELLISRGFDVNITDKYRDTAPDPNIVQIIKQRQSVETPLNVKTGFCAAQYVHITGLPQKCSAENIRLMFKRYGFVANVTDNCINFKSDHVLVKIREHRIRKKIENIAHCFCFGYKIKAKLHVIAKKDSRAKPYIPSKEAISRSRFPAPIRKNAASQNGYQTSRYKSSRFEYRYNGYSHNNGASYKATSNRYSRYNTDHYSNGY